MEYTEKTIRLVFSEQQYLFYSQEIRSHLHKGNFVMFCSRGSVLLEHQMSVFIPVIREKSYL